MKNETKKNGHACRQTGFTLIELIVTVTIIAVLTVVGVVSYSGTNKKARDNRRMADLEKIRVALELYRQATGSTYPVDEDSLVPTYLQAFPVDPKGNNYTYLRLSDYKYTITTTLEETGVGYSVTNP